MALVFYPYEDDLQASSFDQKLEAFMDAAERYKAIVLETSPKPSDNNFVEGNSKRRSTPRELTIAFNWDGISKLLRTVREMTEATSAAKLTKAQLLMKLAEIYEVLRAAKMPKLEAVRLALINEAKQLQSGVSGAQVA